MLAEDAMTYATAPVRKRFIDQTACIGTEGCCLPASECRCGDTMMNSYQRLAAALGYAVTPPTLAITAPADRDTVPSGFVIEVEAVDADGIAQVEIFIDSTLAATLTSPPFTLTAPASLRLGLHTIAARTEDVHGNATETPVITVVRGEVREPEFEPSAGDEGGCHASDAGGFGALLVGGLTALVVRRRRRRR